MSRAPAKKRSKSTRVVVQGISAVYSIEEVAEFLNLHVESIRRWIRSGDFPAIRLGKEYRIAAEDLSDWLEEHKNMRDHAMREEPDAAAPNKSAPSAPALLSENEDDAYQEGYRVGYERALNLLNFKAKDD